MSDARRDIPIKSKQNVKDWTVKYDFSFKMLYRTNLYKFVHIHFFIQKSNNKYSTVYILCFSNYL